MREIGVMVLGFGVLKSRVSGGSVWSAVEEFFYEKSDVFRVLEGGVDVWLGGWGGLWCWVGLPTAPLMVRERGDE
jgi:hypothetical protein